VKPLAAQLGSLRGLPQEQASQPEHPRAARAAEVVHAVGEGVSELPSRGGEDTRFRFGIGLEDWPGVR
jgi:hypothetical protein